MSRYGSSSNSDAGILPFLPLILIFFIIILDDDEPKKDEPQEQAVVVEVLDAKTENPEILTEEPSEGNSKDKVSAEREEKVRDENGEATPE